jgi:hypothetical protein
MIFYVTFISVPILICLCTISLSNRNSDGSVTGSSLNKRVEMRRSTYFFSRERVHLGEDPLVRVIGALKYLAGESCS